MHFTKTALAALMLAFGAAAVQAQPADAASTPRADKREARQQARIDQGVASGQLTKREAARLERQQARVQGAEAQAKADGKVTKREKAKLEHMQDHTSRNIARQKHDAQNKGQ